MSDSNAAPGIVSFSGAAQDGESGQAPDSLQVVVSTPIVLTWQVSNAPDGVELTDPASGPQDLAAGTSSATVVPTADEQDYVLVAIAGQSRSTPATVHVSTHAAGDAVSAHAQLGAPLPVLSGTMQNELGTALPNWPFQLFDAQGNEITPDALAASGGSATPAATGGGFVTGADASYSISGAPGGASVQPVAPLAPIDTSNGPASVPAGAPTTDGGRLSTLVGWIKSKASVVKSDASAFANVVKDDAGEAVGYAELLGLRYPVKAYQAQVSTTLWRGSRLDAAGLQDLASRGFHGAVNFCKEYDDSSAVSAAGLNPLHIGVIDNTAPTYAQIKQFLDFVTTPANQPAYCHCEAGVGRTGVFCASYRIAVSGFTTDQAVAEAKKYGLSLQSQISFLEKLGPDILAGQIAGYPSSGAPSAATTAAPAASTTAAPAPAATTTAAPPAPPATTTAAPPAATSAPPTTTTAAP